MSIEQQIRPFATRIPHAEIVNVASNRHEANVDRFEGMWGAERGNALKALLNVAVCKQVNIPDLELHKGIEALGRYFAKTDSIIVMHGPFSERAGGIPEIGHDKGYCGWHGTADNDTEATVVSTLPPSVLEVALRYSQNTIVENTITKNTSGFYRFGRSDWSEPSWNIQGQLPLINRFFTTSYQYFQKKYPAIDFHFVTGVDPVTEFLTIYGNRYSNVFGARFVACFINPSGSLDQKIWQPIKPEKAPKEHSIKLIREEIFKMAWIIPESIKMAVDTWRYSSIVKKEAEIDRALVSKLSSSLSTQTEIVTRERGQDWLTRKVRKKLETAYHRVGIKGKEKVVSELKNIGWFDAVGINP